MIGFLLLDCRLSCLTRAGERLGDSFPVSLEFMVSMMRGQFYRAADYFGLVPLIMGLVTVSRPEEDL